MGTDTLSPQKELDWARPEHTATSPSFRMDVTEVTVDAYRRCVEAGPCSPPTDLPHHPQWPTCSWYGAARGNHPVNCVTWEQADAYCRWAKKQLPTEEMWELAARGPHGREFPWGRKVPNQTWGAPDDVYQRLEGSCRTPDHESDYDTCPVGSAPLGATPEGILDLAGNVSEWTTTPSCDYGKKGKCYDNYRIARGGTNDWYDYPHRTWTVYRGSEQLGKANATIGFRCVKLDNP
jgi:formylglycine-generating enzyme required for sulfatase activity